MKPIFEFAVFLFALFCCASSAMLAGCATDPIIQEHMVIAPNTLTFRSPTTDSTISITHTCSCPFSWHDSVSPPASWLTFPTYQSGDKSDVPISINRALLTADTSRATIIIVSNSYGNDSILVTAIK
jgi:hypothetical protein